MHRSEEQQVRYWIRHILEENINPSRQLIVEYTKEAAGGVAPRSSGNWGKTFYDPFADIFRASKLALERVIAATDYNLRVMFTIRPSKMKSYRANYLKKTERIEKDMDTVLDAARKAAGPDLELGAFMMNPGWYVTKKGTVKTAEEAAGAWKWLDSAIGQETPTGGDKEDDDAAGGYPGQVIGGLLQDLNKLFFFGHHAPEGQVISEQEGAEGAEGGDGVAYIEKKFAESGLGDFIDKRAKQMIVIKQDQVDEVMEMLRPQLEFIQGLLDAKDAAEFGIVIDKAKAEDIDIGIDVNKLETDIGAAADKVLDDETSREMILSKYKSKAAGDQTKGELGEQDEPSEPDEQDWMPSDEVLRNDAETMILKGALKEGGLIDSLLEAEAALKTQALELIDEPWLEGDAVAAIKETGTGQEFLKVMDDAIAKIKDA
ncbi:MAG TPA: hypothetical protein EYG51_16745 [Pseudomonadales bacterium]|nr:hypothetical protein [Pseudomonadales bacterium]